MSVTIYRDLPTHLPRQWVVYAVWGRTAEDPDWLYVGMTGQPNTRIGQHLDGAVWAQDAWSVTFYPCSGKAEAEELERQLIRRLDPIWNVRR